MKYLIIIPYQKYSFLTKLFKYKKHYVEGMIILDLELSKISFNGIDFEEIEEDNL